MPETTTFVSSTMRTRNLFVSCAMSIPHEDGHFQANLAKSPHRSLYRIANAANQLLAGWSSRFEIPQLPVSASQIQG